MYYRLRRNIRQTGVSQFNDGLICQIERKKNTNNFTNTLIDTKLPSHL